MWKEWGMPIRSRHLQRGCVFPQNFFLVFSPLWSWDFLLVVASSANPENDKDMENRAEQIPTKPQLFLFPQITYAGNKLFCCGKPLKCWGCLWQQWNIIQTDCYKNQLIILNLLLQCWLVWLSGLSVGLWSKGSPVWFLVRAHAWTAGQVPSWGRTRDNHTLMFFSLSFSFPFSLKINK